MAASGILSNITIKILRGIIKVKDKRVLQVQPDYKEAYQRYLDKNDDRVAKGKRPISFEDWLWKQVEKGGGIE